MHELQLTSRLYWPIPLEMGFLNVMNLVKVLKATFLSSLSLSL